MRSFATIFVATERGVRTPCCNPLTPPWGIQRHATAWLLDVTSSAQDPSQILAGVADASWIPLAQRAAIYQRILQFKEDAVGKHTGFERQYAEQDLASWQVRWIRYLVRTKQYQAAATAIAALPKEIRDAQSAASGSARFARWPRSLERWTRYSLPIGRSRKARLRPKSYVTQPARSPKLATSNRHARFSNSSSPARSRATTWSPPTSSVWPKSASRRGTPPARSICCAASS